MIENRNQDDAKFIETKTMLTEMTAETAALAHIADGRLPDVAADWITPQYLLSLRGHLASHTAGPERFKLLRLAVGDIVALQRGGHSAARLQLERERLDLDLQKHRDALAAARQEIQQLRDPKLPLSDADRLAIIAKADEILGLN